jgi:uncharacterized membrane protein
MADETGDTGEADKPRQQRYPFRVRAAIGPGGHGRFDPVSRAGHLEYDRILFFTDAVFAIAITLLIVDLPVQVERTSSSSTFSSSSQLHKDLPGIIGFGISFAVVALFWLAHHSMYRYIKAIDRPLVLLNLLFLGIIAFLPYPTELLSASSNSQTTATVFYAICAGSAGLLETISWYYAMRAGLIEGLDQSTQRLFLLRAARVPATFAISIGIAFFSPRGASYFWIAIAVSGWVLNHYYDRRTRGDETAEPVEG